MAKIKYKGELLAEITDNQPITLHTTGHSLSGDITIEDLTGSGIIKVDKLPTKDINADTFYLYKDKYYKYNPGADNIWVLNDEINFDNAPASIPHADFEIVATLNIAVYTESIENISF